MVKSHRSSEGESFMTGSMWPGDTSFDNSARVALLSSSGVGRWFLRRIQNQITPTMSIKPTTPPIAPPIIAPVSELDPEDCGEVGFPASMVEDDEGCEDVGIAVFVDEDCEDVGFAASIEVTEATV